MSPIRHFSEAVGVRIFNGYGPSLCLASVPLDEELGHYVFAFSVVTILSVQARQACLYC